MTLSMFIVLGIAALAVLLFVWEPVPLDVTALLVLVLLVLLEPWTQINATEAISGFSNPATITVLAMLILSAGIRHTGLIQRVARRLSRLVKTSERRQLVATLGMGGPISGFMNNTPVVALLMPVVSEMAHKGGTSPSKLLLPLSYAAMLGGTLTLIGTSTNILAANLSQRILGHSIGMFDFTGLGLVVLVTGVTYLAFAAPRLLPAHVAPRESYLESFKLAEYMREIKFWADAPMLGVSVQDWLAEANLGIQALALCRNGSVFEHPGDDQVIREDDSLLVHGDANYLKALHELDGVEVLEIQPSRFQKFMNSNGFESLVEVVLVAGSGFEERTVEAINFAEKFDAYVLALRSHSETLREHFSDQLLRAGDSLLLQTTRDGIEHLRDNPDVLILRDQQDLDARFDKIPVSIAILIAVVLLAAFDVFPIVVTSLAGVVAMLLCGVIRPSEMYHDVDWRVIFMLAGIIPLGLALEQTGTAAFLGNLLAQSSAYLPAIAVLWLFYIATGLITEFISNNAAAILMIPVAAATATEIGANPFAFVLAVMFAASTAFMGPIGYQTNLFVYGPGGYQVRDFIRIGAPLHVLLSVVTVGGISMYWGLG